MNEDIVVIFKKLLVLDNPQISHLTLKNYLSDLRHFTNWYSKSLNKQFSPNDINLDIVTLYTKVNGAIIEDGDLVPNTSLSNSSMKRHISSLKKFFLLLKKENPIFTDPFDSIETKKLKPVNEIFKISEFKNSLLLNNASSLTVKNYMSDIASFSRWYDEEFISNGDLQQNPDHQLSIDQSTVDLYKKFLLGKGALRSVNRKLSSLRKYIEFCQKNGIAKTTEIVITNVSKRPQDSTTLQDSTSPDQ